MKKSKILMNLLVCSIVIPFASSCAPDIKQFKKDCALELLPDKNYSLKKNFSFGERTFDYEENFLYDSANNIYTSVYSNKNIQTANLKYKHVNNDIYYYDSNRLYDVIGESIDLEFNFDKYKYLSTKYILTNENSYFYLTISGMDPSEAVNKIHVIEQVEFESDYDTFTIFKVPGDTTYRTRSIILNRNYQSMQGYNSNYYVNSIEEISSFNDKEYRFIMNENGGKYEYSASAKNGDIEYNFVGNNRFIDNTVLLYISFADRHTFQYKIQKVNSKYDNNFTFIDGGVKYKASYFINENKYENNIDFVPYAYKLNKEGNVACMLVKKIMDDQGNLSNKYYTMTIQSTYGKFSGFSEDITLFTEDINSFIFKGKIIELEPNERLLFWVDDFYFILDRNGYVRKMNANKRRVQELGINDIATFKKASIGSINNKYVFRDSEIEYIYDEINDEFIKNFLYDMIYLSYDFGLRIENKSDYLNPAKVYCLGELIDTCYGYKNITRKQIIFGEYYSSDILLLKSKEGIDYFDRNCIFAI